MFCLLCRVHNTKNKYNKQNTFNQAPSTNFKHSAVSDHARASGHTSTIICELERRNSSLAHQHKVASEVTAKITYNAFLSSYWLGKEEVASKKLLSLIELQKQIGVTEMKEFKNTSERSQRDMRLFLGQLIKEKLIERVKDAKWFSLLVDEVTDCATIEQLLIYVGYVDEEGKPHFDFLEVKDVLEISESADSETITKIITEELKASGLNLAFVCGFGSDGASVMTGKNNGVGARLQKVCNVMVRSHCISHRLALACSDANDTVKYIQTIEVVLRQLWKWLEYPKRCSAFVKVCVALQKIELANENPAKQKRLSKSLAVKIQRACRTRWLSTGQSVSSICRNLVALMQTLRQFKDADATAQGLLQRMNNTKFVGTMLLMNAVLPHLNTLSKLFQKDHTCYTSIRPALQSTISRIADIRSSLNLVSELKNAIQPGGHYAALELELSENGQVQAFLNNLVNNYTTALETNLDRRFQEAAPVLEAFSIFDPTCLPNPGNAAFKDYGVDKVGVLCKQFQFDKDHTLAQWDNFKYLMSSWKVPPTILRGKDDLSPTDFILRKIVKEQASHRINFPHIVDAAQICLTQPMSNAVVERGASAVKRVKTRLRSRLKNDMLASLLHISLNGPSHKSEECKAMLTEATKVWRKTHFRNLPSLKKLPKVGGSDHEGSLYHPVAKVDIGVQVEPADDLPTSEAMQDSEVFVESELDRHVQVAAQPVASEADLCHDALDAMDMGDVESGVDSDFEFDLEDYE